MSIEMRKALGEEMARLMREDKRVCLFNADLANVTGLGGFRELFPDRAYDVGIAEANMTSVAAGMATYGFIPFIVSFAPFVTRRNCDQVMLSVAYAKQNVKIIGTDPGVTAATNGGTHMPFEDLAIMRAIPTMLVIDISDVAELRQCLRAAVEHEGPVYLRMPRKLERDVHTAPDYRFELFHADVLRSGTDVTILASGHMLAIALDAAQTLSQQGVQAEVVEVHTLKPLDGETILESVKKTGCAVTVDNHNVIGGLYSAVSELLCLRCPLPVERVGVEDEFGEVGSTPALEQRFGLTAENIVEKSLRAISRKKR